MADTDDNIFCVYLYTNKINGKKYVGKAKNASERDRRHVYASKHLSYPLKTPFEFALKKYGRDKFTFAILKENLTEDEAFKFETIFIEKFNTLLDNGNGYNANTGGKGGHSLTESSKQKHSESMKKAWANNENLRSIDRNNKISEGISRYLAENPDKHVSKKAEVRLKKSQRLRLANPMKNPETAKKFIGDNNPMKRNDVAEKHRAAVQISHRTDEYRSKMSEISKISHSFDETRKKMSENSWMKTEEGRKRFSGTNNPVARAVRCIDTGEVFGTIKETEDHFGFKRVVGDVCRGRRKRAHGLRFEFVE